MKRNKWVLSVLLALLISAPSAIAKDLSEQEDGPGKTRKAKREKAQRSKNKDRPLRGQYAIMVAELGMDDQQKTQVMEIAQQKAAAVQAWQQANGEKNEQLKQEAKQAREDKDRAKGAEIAKQRRQLREDQQKVAQPFDDRIVELLTPEQKRKWQAFGVYRDVTRRLARCKLTDTQKAQIKRMAAEATPRAASVKEAAAQVQTQAAGILTEEQKQKMPRMKPGRDRPATEDRSGRKGKAKGRKGGARQDPDLDDEGFGDSE
jgi:Spy/CpxP family protein refolding chaperone